MRLAVLLGMSVLGLSGAVAYGAIGDISRQLAPLPLIQSDAPKADAAFAAAGLVTLRAPEPDRPAQRVAIAATGIVAAEPPVVVMAFSLRPKARPDQADPAPVRVSQPAPRAAAKPAVVRSAPPKRAFKMPWQTGVFQ